MNRCVAIVNASQWCSTNSNGKHYYSPHVAFMDAIQKQAGLSTICRQTYTPFAGIIYDSVRQSILAVRDHFGLGPFYYSYINDQFIFGSRIPDLLKHMPSPPAMNTEQIHHLRLRIEYSAVAAKSLGFNYVYPLLYAPLSSENEYNRELL